MTGSTVIVQKGTNISNKRHQNMSSVALKRLLHNRMAMLGVCIVIFLILISIFAPVLSPYSYTKIDMSGAYANPSLRHLFGQDELGRDILTRLLYGGRYSIAIGILSALLGMAFGVCIGAPAGFFGGKVDNVIMRFMDIFQALPSMLLAVVIASVLGPGFITTVIALGVGCMSGNCRMTRASILSVREMEYVEAAIASNCSQLRIIVKHVLPNAIAPVLVNISNSVSSCVLASAGLSFIGLGVQPPTPEWGAMLSGSRNFVRSHPHMVIFPGIMICVFVLAFNLFSDGLRDALDPKLKK